MLPIGAGMRWNNVKVTDHNRAPIAIEYQKQEYLKRMANGTLRRFFVAEKRAFKTGWEMLPQKNAIAVDGFWAADAIEDFYLATNGSFILTLTYGNNTTENITCMFTSFSKQLVTRSSYVDMYNVDVSLEEV